MTKWLPFVLLPTTTSNQDWKAGEHSKVLAAKTPAVPQVSKLCCHGQSAQVEECEEKCDVTKQLIFGVLHPHYDVFYLIVLSLEYKFKFHPEQNEFIFCIDWPEDPIRIKKR